MDGLAAVNLATSLTPALLTPQAGMDAVPELTRLLVELEQPRLRILASAILRNQTGVEFGQVSSASTKVQLEVIATRYRYLADAAKAAAGK